MKLLEKLSNVTISYLGCSLSADPNIIRIYFKGNALKF